jgi:hypothetical protein
MPRLRQFLGTGRLGEADLSDYPLPDRVGGDHGRSLGTANRQVACDFCPTYTFTSQYGATDDQSGLEFPHAGRS